MTGFEHWRHCISHLSKAQILRMKKEKLAGIMVEEFQKQQATANQNQT